MEEIKVGEYVRSLVNGGISKVLEVSDLLEEPNIKYYKTGKFTGFCSTELYNVKHSINIIDILKIGDFIHTDYGWGWYHHKVDEETIVIDDGDEFIDVKKDEIHRILTQEMLWNNSYEVGD